MALDLNIWCALCYRCLESFVKNSNAVSMTFPPILSKQERAIAHRMAEDFLLEHWSDSTEEGRVLKIKKVPLKTLKGTNVSLGHSTIHNAYFAIVYLISFAGPAERQVLCDQLERTIADWETVVAARSAAEHKHEDSELDLAESGYIPFSVEKKCGLRFVAWNIEWMDHFFEPGTYDLQLLLHPFLFLKRTRHNWNDIACCLF